MRVTISSFWIREICLLLRRVILVSKTFWSSFWIQLFLFNFLCVRILVVLDTFEINKTFLWSLPKLFCLWKGVSVARPAGQLDCNGLIISLKKLHRIEAFF